MSLVVTRPLTISELLDAGFQLYKRCLVPLLPLTLICAIVAALPSVFFAPSDASAGKMQHPVAFSGWMLASWLVTMALYVALIRKIDDIAEGRNQLSLVDACLGATGKLPAVIGATLLFGLILVGGMVLLVIPGIIFMLSMSFFLYFLALEDKGPVESLKCSHQLVWGHWWRWAAIYTVSLIIFVGLYAIVGALAVVVGHAIGGSDKTAAAAMAQIVGQVVLTTVSTPFIYSVQLIGFRDLQLRKGGDDLAARIAQAA